MSEAHSARNTAASNLPVLDVERVRSDFPILHQEVHGKPLAYLDNAATSQKPQCVIDAISEYYARDNSNVHRGVHALSERATKSYEDARVTVQEYLNAASAKEIVYVRGTTEAINLVAQSFVRPRLECDDEIIISEMEHHSNIVPWQLLCRQTGAKLRVIPVNDAGELLIGEYEKLLGPRTRFVSVVHLSNSLGTINPVKRIIDIAHAQGVPVLIDGAQAAPHAHIDVQALDCDFYAFSGHKTYGPTGIGALYGKHELLDAMDPYQSGGEMIRRVTFEETLYADVPHKFEAGTPNIAGAVGLGRALQYVNELGLDTIAAHEDALLGYATEAVHSITGLRIIGTASEKAGILAFVLDDAHAHDIGTIMDREGVAIRAGHHCTMPLMQRFGLAATARASFAAYNNKDDVDAFLVGIEKVQEIFRR